MYDAVVVGAGPGGATSAYYLAKAGYKVALIDKSKFPRFKPCGDGISIRTVYDLDFKIPDEVIHQNLYGASLISDRNELFIGRVDRKVGFTSTRNDFDHFLVQKAHDIGVDLFESTNIKNLSKNNGSYTVSSKDQDFQGKFIIGADGANTKIGRLSGLYKQPSPDQNGIAVRTYIEFSESEFNQFVVGKDILELYFFPIPMGYGWVFPLRNAINIGIGGIASEMNPLNEKFRDFYNKLFKIRGMEPKPYQHYQGHPLPPGGFDRTIAKDRILLIGDAAGLIDPFSGEGIHWAVRSGKEASSLIIKAFEGEDPELVARKYERYVDSNITKNLKSALKATYRIHDHLNKFFRVLKYNTQAIYYFVNLADGTDDYISLMRRIYFYRLWILGARAILGKLRFIKPDPEIYKRNMTEYFENRSYLPGSDTHR